MTAHRIHTSRAHHDVTGIRSSGLSWSYVNGPIQPMERSYGGRTLVKLCCVSAALVAGIASAILIGAVL